MTYIVNSEQTTTPLKGGSSLAERANTCSEYVYTPYPSLTVSQRLELNKILHTGELTNNNVSTFSEQDMYDDDEQQPEEQKQNHGCCVIC